MLAGRPHEAAGNGSPRWMAVGPLHAGAQNPAYRPARPPPAPVTSTGANEEARRGTFRAQHWTSADIADFLTDRGADPLLRSYLWSYPAGINWFIQLAQAPAEAQRSVLEAAYRDPLTPGQMAELWPAGPDIGGPGPSPRLA